MILSFIRVIQRITVAMVTWLSIVWQYGGHCFCELSHTFDCSVHSVRITYEPTPEQKD
ncbi:hypothetical protein EC142370_00871 [Escherichia coli O145:H34]|nr:hypothetical protein EC142370_00871 [Escherichia coli O145:H34]